MSRYIASAQASEQNLRYNLRVYNIYIDRLKVSKVKSDCLSIEKTMKSLP